MKLSNIYPVLMLLGLFIASVVAAVLVCVWSWSYGMIKVVKDATAALYERITNEQCGYISTS